MHLLFRLSLVNQAKGTEDAEGISHLYALSKLSPASQSSMFQTRLYPVLQMGNFIFGTIGMQ